MIRLLLLSVLLSTLAACGQYREPRANCFSFIASTEDDDTCTFFKLGGPETGLGVDD